jgi:hypothetical protein
MAESQWRIGDEQRKPDAGNTNTEGEYWACWNKCAWIYRQMFDDAIAALPPAYRVFVEC